MKLARERNTKSCWLHDHCAGNEWAARVQAVTYSPAFLWLVDGGAKKTYRPIRSRACGLRRVGRGLLQMSQCINKTKECSKKHMSIFRISFIENYIIKYHRDRHEWDYFLLCFPISDIYVILPIKFNVYSNIRILKSIITSYIILQSFYEYLTLNWKSIIWITDRSLPSIDQLPIHASVDRGTQR